MDRVHRYDDVERRFRDSARNPERGRAIVAELLHLPDVGAVEGLRYDLSFYSGGIGVLDKLAISLPLPEPQVAVVVAARGDRAPAEANAIIGWAEDFRWLVTGDEVSDATPGAVSRFINEERFDFQPECRPEDSIWFAPESDVNWWQALWLVDGVLSLRGYAQG